jgi:DNA-binding transcriptional LysR family regulator
MQECLRGMHDCVCARGRGKGESSLVFEWSDARVFLAVCREGSFTAAAKRLSMNQTTVGRRIGALEQSLGAKLFRRGSDGLALTSAGEDARVLAEQMETAADGLDRRLHGRDRTVKGVVRVTTAESFARAFLAPRLGPFVRRYPAIEISLRADSRVLSLARREADVAIRHWKPSQPDLVARKIGQVAFALYASPAYAAARSGSGDAFLGFEGELSTMPDAELLERLVQSPQSPLRSSSRAVLEGGAVGGLGIALLPCYLGDGREDLVRVCSQEPVLVRDLWMVMHSDMRGQATLRAFASFLVAEVDRAGDVLLGRRVARKDEA